MRVSEPTGSRQLTRTDKKSPIRSLSWSSLRLSLRSLLSFYALSFSCSPFCKENTTLTDGRRATWARRDLTRSGGGDVDDVKATNSLVGALSSKRNREFKCHRSVMRSFLTPSVYFLSPFLLLFLVPRAFSTLTRTGGIPDVKSCDNLSFSVFISNMYFLISIFFTKL